MTAMPQAATGLYPGTTGTLCGYDGGGGNGFHAQLAVLSARSRAATKDAFDHMQAYYAPAHGIGVLLGEKHNQIVMVRALTPSVQNKLAALLAEAMRGL